jgi:UBX domain-containing protein 7
MDDSLVAEFTSITSASPAQAQAYLRITDNNLEQAIELFFDDPNLTAEPAEPAQASASRPPHREDSHGVIHIDSDDNEDVVITGTHTVGPDTSEDAEIARQLQQELFATADGDADEARVPMLRTRETLVGGDDDDYQGSEIDSIVQQQLRDRERRRRERQSELG